MEEFRISFNKISKSYEVGEYVAGQVDIGTIEQLTIEGLTIRFIGGATINSGKKQNMEMPEHDQTFDGNEMYFDETFTLSEACTIEANKKYSFSFQYKLPNKAMPRVCSSNEGRVFYAAEATLKRPSIFQSNLKEIQDFSILTNVNLNSFGDAEDPGTTAESWSNSIFCLKNKRVSIACNTPYKGVCAGKMIPFQITARNQSGKAVKDIRVELVQKWVFWCSGNTKRKNYIVKRLPRTFKVPPHCSLEWKDSLRVPADMFQPTQGTHLCRVINVDYVLRFTPVQDWSCCSPPVLEIPIYVGDVPLTRHTYSETHAAVNNNAKNGAGESDLWRKSNMSIARKSNVAHATKKTRK
ncbi:unnamed protein product [Orchesella dallaii]|uniref:Arrestin C-terminal-like domain-containing protein n=1 Tax=Orchesella dallaii TaxID=48710 RepID=A0ABP1R9W4_9HEXA